MKCSATTCTVLCGFVKRLTSCIYINILYYDEESGKWTKTRKTADDGEYNPSCQYNNANTIASAVLIIIFILIVDY